MEGMVVGDRREVAVTFPDTWVPESLAGLDAKCFVTVNELFEFELVEVRPRSFPAHLQIQKLHHCDAVFIHVAPCLIGIS